MTSREVLEVLNLEERKLTLYDAGRADEGYKLHEEQKRLMAEMPLDDFLSAKRILFRARHTDYTRHEHSEQVCACGHGRGHHGGLAHIICTVGNHHWNSYNHRHDPPCCCSGFITKEDALAELEAEEAELAQERAEAEFWCESCQEAVDEPDTRYECGYCGCTFGYADEGSNHYPDCGKFASKTSENACPTCGDEELVRGRA